MIETMSISMFELVDLHQNDLKLYESSAIKPRNVSKVGFQTNVDLLNQRV